MAVYWLRGGWAGGVVTVVGDDIASDESFCDCDVCRNIFEHAEVFWLLRVEIYTFCKSEAGGSFLDGEVDCATSLPEYCEHNVTAMGVVSFDA